MPCSETQSEPVADFDSVDSPATDLFVGPFCPLKQLREDLPRYTARP